MAKSHVSLEAFDADLADFDRVLAAIDRAQKTPLKEMRELEWVHDFVCSVGLAQLPPNDETYGEFAHLVNGSHQGVGQYPMEFARWLHLLGSLPNLRTYLEIGCYNGNTACLAAAYLTRFHPGFSLVTIDIWPWFLFEPAVQGLVPVEYRMRTTSYDLRHQTFDAVFIDGDHTFEWAWADYQNIGRRARICGLHDIKSAHYLENFELGGVTAAWELIKRGDAAPGYEFLEFSDHPAADRFGIGVRLRK